MKKFTLILFTLLCFGIAKAHFLPKNFKTLKPQIEIRGINALPDYNVTFKVFPEKIFRCGPAPKAKSFQNELMMENSAFVFTPVTIRKDKNGFAAGIYLRQ